MERYLEQLIEEIQQAMTRKPTPGDLWDGVDMDNPAEVEDIAYVEQLMNGSPVKLSKVVGIEYVQFPPSERLSDTQATKLYMHMKHLLQAFNFYPDFPPDLPSIYKYETLRNQWDMEVLCVTAGEAHLDLCDLEPDTCPFPSAYCTCNQMENDEPDNNPDAPLSDSDLPF